MRRAPFTALAALRPPRADIEIDHRDGGDLTFAATMAQGGTVTITVAHDFPEDHLGRLREDLSGRVHNGHPLLFHVERAVAPPDPGEPRVTLTSGRAGQ